MSLRYFERPLGLQVELSTVCNALCLGCVRTDQDSFAHARPTIPKGRYLDTDLLLSRLIELETPLLLLEFCGNIDEPTLHPKFLELLDRFADHSPQTTIYIHTNGATRDAEYFRSLSEILQRFQEHRVRFSIDGLSDTHAIYRQRTSFEKIIENAKSFIDAGGMAIWQMIQFPWNEHQTDAAEALARELGFKQFLSRKDRSMKGKTYEHYLQVVKQRQQGAPPQKRPSLQKSSLQKNYFPHHLEPRASFDIDCFFKKLNYLFLSWDAKLWPCCFMANVYYEGQKERVDFFHRNFYGSSPHTFNSIEQHSLAEILEQEPFLSQLVSGWDPSSQPDKKIWRCVEKCSIKEEVKAPIKITSL